MYGKMHQLPFHGRDDKATRVHEILFTDVYVPKEVKSIGRKLYYVDFKDNFSGFRMIHFVRHKSEVFETVKIVCAEMKNHFSERIKELHSVGGEENGNDRIAKYLGEKGIQFTINAPYTPEQNGVTERDHS